MGIGGQVVLQLGELFEPVAPHQIGPGGKGLAHLDEAGAQVRERCENAPSQSLLHLGIAAVPLHHQHQGQAGQLPDHHEQPGYQHPGAQQQPAQVSAWVVTQLAGSFGVGQVTAAAS